MISNHADFLTTDVLTISLSISFNVEIYIHFHIIKWSIYPQITVLQFERLKQLQKMEHPVQFKQIIFLEWHNACNPVVPIQLKVKRFQLPISASI